jgi:LysM repeat protein
MNIWLRIGLLILGLLFLASAAPAEANSANEIVQLVNAVRANHGLPPYQVNSALTAAAQNHANWMSQTAIYSHTGAGGSTPQSRATAAGYAGFATENIVGGTNMTPRQGVIWWQNSPVHYNTLVSTRYIEVGVGFATNGEQNFYVLVAGRPSSAGGTAPAPSQPAARPLIITPIQLAQPGEDGSIIHTVQPGQALWSLAAHYETPLTEILQINNMRENVILQPGDQIVIRLPEGAEPPPTPTPPLTHRVAAGQTLWAIAAQYNVRLGDLLWYNNLGEEDILQPGQEITVRLAEGQEPPPTPTPITHHRVRAGQTLWDVALTHGLTLEQLLAYNGITADKILQIGEELRIRPPDPTATPTAVPPTFTPTLPAATPTPTPAATVTPPAPSIAAAPTTPVPISTEPIGESPNLVNIAALVLGALIVAGLGWGLRR